MTEEIKDLNKEVDKLEGAVKKYASKDTVISIGGYEFTPAKLMVAFTVISSILGGLYGTFEVYKDYVGMKKRIAEYVAPDLSVFDKRLAVIEENSQKSTDYTRDIKNDLKNDIRKIEGVVEGVERSNRQIQREVNESVASVQKELRAAQHEVVESQKSVERAITQVQRDMDRDLRNIRRETDDKIKKALDNPLAK